MTWQFDCWIHGEPASAKNQRRIVKIGGQPRLIKSKKALEYSDLFHAQCPMLKNLIEGDVFLWVDVYYRSRRPDLSCLELISDLLQGYAYANDRQVKMNGSSWNLDREEPRVRIRCLQIGDGTRESYSGLVRLEDIASWVDPGEGDVE